MALPTHPIGLLIDRTNTRFGRFRPFMMIGCILVAVAQVAIFNTPTSFGATCPLSQQVS